MTAAGGALGCFIRVGRGMGHQDAYQVGLYSVPKDLFTSLLFSYFIETLYFGDKKHLFY